MTSKVQVSIVIRTFNEEKGIARLLGGIRRQRVSFKYEVIIVDSGSTDNTLAVTSKFRVKVVKILPEEFSFALSLNKGIEKASGEYIVMISAHCYPKDEFWLENLTKPFANESIALVYGKQRGNHTTKFSEHQVFEKWFPGNRISKQNFAFCNNANAAIRKSLWNKQKYNESLTGLEDIEWAKNALKKEFFLCYNPDAEVIHVHSETPYKLFRRYEREAVAFRTIYPEQSFTFFDFVKLWFLNTLRDYFCAIRRGVLVRNLLSIPVWRFLQFWGTFRGNKYKGLISSELIQRFYYPRKLRISLRFRKKERPQKNIQIYDISTPLSEDTVVWPTSEKFTINWVKNLKEHGVNESHISFNSHTGTHLDVPYHFLDCERKVKDVALHRLIGKVFVLEFFGNGSVGSGFLDKVKIPKGCNKILLKTLSSIEYAFKKSFQNDYVALNYYGAKWIVENGIDLVGIDSLSIQEFDDKENMVHKFLLEKDVIILEGLNLESVEEGLYNLVALPLNIPEAESAPVRAILSKENLW